MLLLGLFALILAFTAGNLAGCDKDDDAEIEEGEEDHDENPCHGKKPIHADATAEDEYFKNLECEKVALEQAGSNVTKGYTGTLDTTGREPVITNYSVAGLCPVNVHWHLGTEHLSVGEYDESGAGPDDAHRRLAATANVRLGYRCHLYNASNTKFTTEYQWEHCVGMHVGETYEVHWPHSAAGDCNTKWQYQSPFYDGVFCNDGIISLDPLNTYQKIGVQAQIFTIINDEDYYYPDLFKGMRTDAEFGADITAYTGSTTGTSRDNEMCSRYTPITWQVDRNCHLISASSFDKMCKDMKAQADDMSYDLHAHGSRELVVSHYVADNHADIDR